MKPNTPVRITVRAGLLAHPDAARFEDEVAEPGTIGSYRDLHPDIPGWHRVTVTIDGRELVAPLHSSQFEEVTR